MTWKLHLNPGGCDTTLKAADETDLIEQIKPKNEKYDYDILVMKKWQLFAFWATISILIWQQDNLVNLFSGHRGNLRQNYNIPLEKASKIRTRTQNVNERRSLTYKQKQWEGLKSLDF